MFLAADDLRHSALLSIYLCGMPERLCGQLDSWLTEKVLAQEWRNQTEKYSLKKKRSPEEDDRFILSLLLHQHLQSTYLKVL